MQTIAIIGSGAIGEAVAGYLAHNQDVTIGVAVIEPGMESRARDIYGGQVEVVTDPGE